MKIEEFNAQVKRLSDTFGGQHYKQERLTILWRDVRDFDRQWFERVVDGLIASSKFAPLPSDFSEAVSAERDRKWRAKKETTLVEWRGVPTCRFCKDTGIRMCLKDDAPGVWAFRCECDRGSADPRVQIPQWFDGYDRLGYLWTDLPVYRPKLVSG